LRASFPNAKHTLWPGELVNARLRLETRPGGLTLPSSAVQLGPHGAFVWVIGADEKVQTRPVTVSQLGEGQVLVTQGLQGGEKVVVDGQYRLQQASLVQELQGDAAKSADLQSSVEQAIP
jgi:multidrug efflux system membrane fusion protein